MRVLIQFILILAVGYSSFFVYQYKGTGVSTASMQRALDQKSTGTPLIKVRIKADSPVLRSTGFAMVGHDQVRIQNHLFNLVSLKIFSGFIEFSVLLSDPSDAAKLKSLALHHTGRSGLIDVKQTDHVVLSLPPVAVRINSLDVTTAMCLAFPEQVSAVLVGFPQHFAGPPKACA